MKYNIIKSILLNVLNGEIMHYKTLHIKKHDKCILITNTTVLVAC